MSSITAFDRTGMLVKDFSTLGKLEFIFVSRPNFLYEKLKKEVLHFPRNFLFVEISDPEKIGKEEKLFYKNFFEELDPKKTLIYYDNTSSTVFEFDTNFSYPLDLMFEKYFRLNEVSFDLERLTLLSLNQASQIYHSRSLESIVLGMGYLFNNFLKGGLGEHNLSYDGKKFSYFNPLISKNDFSSFLSYIRKIFLTSEVYFAIAAKKEGKREYNLIIFDENLLCDFERLQNRIIVPESFVFSLKGIEIDTKRSMILYDRHLAESQIVPYKISDLKDSEMYQRCLEFGMFLNKNEGPIFFYDGDSYKENMILPSQDDRFISNFVHFLILFKDEK